MTHRLWTTQGFSPPETSPVFVLIMHSNPFPLSLSRKEPQAGTSWSHGSSTPECRKGPSSDRFLPAALLGKQRAIFSKSPGDSAVSGRALNSKA